jgi:hypothetical protein
MAEESFDAVFDVGIIHHIANWRAPVGEVSRVLRPGGRFLSEEATAPRAGSDGATARSATILATTGLVLSASSASSNASNSTSAIGRSPASSMPSSSVSPPNANHDPQRASSPLSETLSFIVSAARLGQHTPCAPRPPNAPARPSSNPRSATATASLGSYTGHVELTRSDGQVGYAARRSVCQAASFSLGVM